MSTFLRPFILRTLAAASLASLACPVTLATEPNDSTSGDWREREQDLAQFNAFDYRLQHVSEQRKFTTGNFFTHLDFTGDVGIAWMGHSDGLIMNEGPAMKIGAAVTAWGTPVHGVRLQAMMGQHRFGATTWGSRTGSFYGSLGADYMMNFTGLLKGETPSKFEVIGTIGPEVQVSHSNHAYQWDFGGHVGVQTRYNITDKVFMYLEPRIAAYSDRIDRADSWRSFDWEGSLAFGFGVRKVDGVHAFRSPDVFSGRTFTDNTFVQFGPALVSPIKRYPSSTKLKHIGGAGEFYLGKWLTGSSGIRVGFSGGQYKRVETLKKRRYFLGEVDYMFNLTNAINGYEYEPTTATNFFVGPTIGMSPHADGKVYYGATVGFQELWNINPALALYLEPKAHLMSRGFTEPLSNHRPSVLGSLSLGLIYKIGGSETRIDPMSRMADDPNATAHFGAHRWFASAAAGVFSRHYKWTNTGITASLRAGRWINPVVAWRGGAELEYDGPMEYGAAARLMQGGVSADIMVSLTNLMIGYDYHRRVNVNLFAGGEAAVAYYHTPSAGSWHFTPGARGGLQLDVALSDRLSMFFEPSVHAWNSEQFINRRTKFSPELRAEVGFTYHIGSNSSYPDVFEQLATDPQGKAVFDAHRWFVSVQGGVLSRHRPDTGVGFFKSFVKHHGEGNESFAFAASIGRWLNPIMAVRGGYEFEYTTLGTTLKQHSLAADLMFSLTSMALGYDPYRLFDFSLFGGLEAGFGRYKEANDVMINAAEVPRTVLMPGARAGMHVECNVTDRVGIFGEFQTHIWRTPRYLWSVYNHSPELRATVGVAYKF